MNDEARKARNDYMKEWRKRNKDKLKEINRKYWENKVKKITKIFNREE